MKWVVVQALRMKLLGFPVMFTVVNFSMLIIMQIAHDNILY